MLRTHIRPQCRSHRVDKGEWYVHTYARSVDPSGSTNVNCTRTNTPVASSPPCRPKVNGTTTHNQDQRCYRISVTIRSDKGEWIHSALNRWSEHEKDEISRNGPSSASIGLPEFRLRHYLCPCKADKVFFLKPYTIRILQATFGTSDYVYLTLTTTPSVISRRPFTKT